MKDGTLVDIYDSETQAAFVGYIFNWNEEEETFCLYQARFSLPQEPGFVPKGNYWVHKIETCTIRKVFMYTSEEVACIREGAEHGALRSEIEKSGEEPWGIPQPGMYVRSELDAFLDAMDRFADIRKKLID